VMAGHGCAARQAVLVAALLSSLMGGTTPGRAATVVPLSLADLTAHATTIVDATVTEIRHVVGPSGAERQVLVQVGATWKGDAIETRYVRLAGGTIGRYETRVPGAPHVEVGDRLIWFLGAAGDRGHAVIGLHQGAMPVHRAPDGRALVLSAPTASPPTARGATPRVPRRVESLAADVRRLLTRVGPE